MAPAGFEPVISASERAQTHAVDRAATGNQWYILLAINNPVNNKLKTVTAHLK
jgi:hypothetical protein